MNTVMAPNNLEVASLDEPAFCSGWVSGNARFVDA